MLSILARVDRRQLRISILGINYYPEPTGIAPYTTKLAERLVREGHEVHVITGYPHYPDWKRKQGYTGWLRREKREGVRITRLRHYIPRRVNGMQRMHLELSFGLRLLFAGWKRPDVVLVVTPALLSSVFVLLRARLGFRRPSTAIWVQDLYSRGLAEMKGDNSASARLMQRIEGYVFRSATKVCVIHDRFRSYVNTSLGVPLDDIETIRNWTHIDSHGQIDRPNIRARLGWNEGEIIALHAGNIGAKQALENVIAAATVADDRRSNVRFVLLGNGNQRSRIEAMAEGIERIQFIDPLPDADFKDALGSADVLLVNEMSGLREMAVPSKLTSYFSTGLPVVAATEADSTTAGEIRISGGGICVDPDSPAALLDACESLGGDTALSIQLGSKGQHYAATALSEEAAIVQYSDLLERLASAKYLQKPGRGKRWTRKIRNRGIRFD